MKERKPVTREFALRYRAAKNKPEKSKVLNDFIAAAGYNRKYAISILGAERKTKLLRLNGTLLKARVTHKTGKKRTYKKYYGPDVAACGSFSTACAGAVWSPSLGRTLPPWSQDKAVPQWNGCSRGSGKNAA
jgi:hypothetical protein